MSVLRLWEPNSVFNQDYGSWFNLTISVTCRHLGYLIVKQRVGERESSERGTPDSKWRGVSRMGAKITTQKNP